MALIGFVMVAEPGHLNPTFKLAKELRMKGHQIRYFGPAQVEKYIRTQGFQLISIPFNFHRYGEEPPDIINVEQLVREIAGSFEDSQVDFLLVDPFLTLVAKIACQMKVPMAFLSIALRFPYIFDDKTYDIVAEHKPAVIFLCPQEFAYPHAVKTVGRCFYIEPSVDIQRKEAEFPWGVINKNKPLIYCSIGTQGNRYPEARQFLQSVIDAHRIRQDRQLVLTLGGQLSNQEYSDVPSNVVMVDQAPQLKILRKASVVITHGGLGTVKECILFGAPMIVYPFDSDQPLNASKIVSNGLGLRGDPRNTSAEQINSLIDQVTNDFSFRARVEALGRKFREIEHSGVGAYTIEQLIRGHNIKPVPRN
jgi:UDP:flavonoid glycosyltransferase YjiC (YdhE family)